MAIKDSYPAIRPSLDLNFAGSRMVDQRITFTRTSSATYFDEQGVLRTASAGVPRIDHDPVTGECKGLLIEEPRTNMLTYSEQFDNAAWIKYKTTLSANAITAPDGTITADKLVEDTAADNRHHLSSKSVTVSSGAAYTFSIFVKPSTRRYCVVRMNDSESNANAASVVVDLQSGTISGAATAYGAFSAASVRLVAITNGFYRVSLTAKVSTTTIFAKIELSSSGVREPDGQADIYTGDGTSGIYIWGAQLESGSLPTSYIKTEASPVARASDNAVMTGTNFSDWYRQDEGAFVVELSRNASTVQYPAVQVSDVTLLNAIRLAVWGAANTPVFTAISGGVEQVGIVSLAVGAGVFAKIAGVYKANDYAAAFSNYATVQTDTSALVPEVTQMLFGVSSAGHYLNGHIKRLVYYPKRLPNEQLQALTA